MKQSQMAAVSAFTLRTGASDSPTLSIVACSSRGYWLVQRVVILLIRLVTGIAKSSDTVNNGADKHDKHIGSTG